MTTGWKSFGYGDRVVVVDYPGATIMSPLLAGEIIGQGERGKLRVKLDKGGKTMEVYPEDMRHEN